MAKTYRQLSELHPYVKELAEKLISECEKQGIKILITETYRSNERQNELYAQGRTTAGKKVTNAKAGQSIHNYRLAFDFCPMIGGKCAWNRIDLFDRVGQIGESIGLTWGGHFKSFKDRPHFQWTGGLTLKDLQNGQYPIMKQKHWAEEPYNSLINKGIKIHEKRYDDKITRGEVFALLVQILNEQHRQI